MKNRIKIIVGDITVLDVDAIVNAANNSLLGGGGVDGAIHRSAGHKLLEECKALGGCTTGEAKLTSGYNLPAKYVIHTVGPIWQGGNSNEIALLSNCYQHCLEIARYKKIESIAFPAISCGVYKFPHRKACKIALDSIVGFLSENHYPHNVYIVCYNQSMYDVYCNLLADYTHK